MKKTIVRLITAILAAALFITSVFAVSVSAATKPKSASSTATEKTIDYKKALQDLAEGIEARNKILEEDGTLPEAFKAEYDAVADYEGAKYGEGALLDFLADSCVISLKQIAARADLSDLTEEEQEELQPLIEFEIQTYMAAVDLLEEKFDLEIDDYELPVVEEDRKETQDKSDTRSSDKTSSKSKDSTKASKSDATVTNGMKNALRKADVYLQLTGFSYTGLIEQLEYEGFSTEEATYAADHCGADWKEEAVRKGETYLMLTGFSYSGMIEQLEYEGFTHEEAKYAADQLCD